MIDWQLRKARGKLEREERRLEEDWSQAKRRGAPQDELNEIYSGYDTDITLAREEFLRIVTRRLVKEARCRLLPVPPVSKESKMWEEGEQLQGYHLSVEGIAQLNRLIREDKSSRSAPLFAWAGLILGAIGSVAGMAAVLGVKIG